MCFGEINYLIDKYDVNELTFQDDILASTKERMLVFCKKIKPLNFRWICNLRVHMAKDDVLAAMRDAGCYQICYGFESTSPVVLKSMRKGTSAELIESAINATHKAKITIQGVFIFGDPAETLQTMQETINFTRRFVGTHVGFRMVAPYPGTDLYKNLKEKGELNDLIGLYSDPYKIINMTALSKMDFLYLCRKVDFENTYRKVWAFVKILRLKKIAANIYDLDLRCPHCGELNKNCRLDFSLGNLLVCGHCKKRTFVNLADFRFLNISRIYQYCYLYVKVAVLYNSTIHRFLFFVPSLIEKTAAICRSIVDSFQSKTANR